MDSFLSTVSKNFFGHSIISRIHDFYQPPLGFLINASEKII